MNTQNMVNLKNLQPGDRFSYVKGGQVNTVVRQTGYRALISPRPGLSIQVLANHLVWEC